MAPQTNVNRSLYSFLQDEDSIRRNYCTSFSSLWKSPKNILIYTLILSLSAVTGIGGFFSGRYSVHTDNTTLIELRQTPITFKYNRTFAEAPSDVTNQLWDSLFPLKRGFFGHPTLEPDLADFAVYHQLHCLDGIRTAYWNLRTGPHSNERRSKNGEHSSDAHVRHCIDYIRQSLMCMSDTTIEVVEEVSNGDVGVRGFGTQHICRDFRELGEWTSRWEDFKLP